MHDFSNHTGPGHPFFSCSLPHLESMLRQHFYFVIQDVFTIFWNNFCICHLLLWDDIFVQLLPTKSLHEVEQNLIDQLKHQTAPKPLELINRWLISISIRCAYKIPAKSVSVWITSWSPTIAVCLFPRQCDSFLLCFTAGEGLRAPSQYSVHVSNAPRASDTLHTRFKDSGSQCKPFFDACFKGSMGTLMCATMAVW